MLLRLCIILTVLLPVACACAVGADVRTKSDTQLEQLLVHARLREAGLTATEEAFLAASRVLRSEPSKQGIAEYFLGLVEIERENLSAAADYFRSARSSLDPESPLHSKANYWCMCLDGESAVNRVRPSSLQGRISHALTGKPPANIGDTTDIADYCAATVAMPYSETGVAQEYLNSLYRPTETVTVRKQLTDSEVSFDYRFYDPVVFRVQLDDYIRTCWRSAKQNPEIRFRVWAEFLSGRQSETELLLRDARAGEVPESAALQKALDALQARPTDAAFSVASDESTRALTWATRALNHAGHSQFEQWSLEHAWGSIHDAAEDGSPLSPALVRPRRHADVPVVRERMNLYWELAWTYRCAGCAVPNRTDERAVLSFRRAMTVAEQLKSPLVLSAQNRLTDLMRVQYADICMRNEEWELWQKHISSDLVRRYPAAGLMRTLGREVAGDRRLNPPPPRPHVLSEPIGALMTGQGLGWNPPPQTHPTASAVETTAAPAERTNTGIWLAVICGLTAAVMWLLLRRKRGLTVQTIPLKNDDSPTNDQEQTSV
ncbi:MAG: hypothetical protein ABGZ35_22840 [Planctomycetaceae bacterium]